MEPKNRPIITKSPISIDHLLKIGNLKWNVLWFSADLRPMEPKNRPIIDYLLKIGDLKWNILRFSANLRPMELKNRPIIAQSPNWIDYLLKIGGLNRTFYISVLS